MMVAKPWSAAPSSSRMSASVGVVGALAAELLGDGGRAQTQLGRLLEQIPGDAVLRVGLLVVVSIATGLTSFWAKSRTMSRVISCSSVSLKSMRAPSALC